MKSIIMNAMLSALAYAAGIVLPLALLVAAYRLLFHPLARYPGPFPAKLTSAYTAFYAWRLCSHISAYKSFETYDIYNNPKVTKGRAYQGSRMGTERPNIFNAADRDLHRQKRRIIAPTISERAMRSFESEMSKEIDVFLVNLLQLSRNNEVVDMTPLCDRLGMDVVGRLAFGFELKTQSEATYRHIAAGIKARSAINSVYMSWPDLRVLDRLITFLRPRSYRSDLENLYRSLRTMIGARMAIPRDAKHDFYAQVSDKLEPQDLWAEAIMIVGAGGSTTATPISAIFFYLSRYPTAYERLASEIRSGFLSGREISQGPRLNACTYLRAVIDEGLRLSTGTISTWRNQDAASIAAGEELVIDGHIIPPGTEVAINAYSFMRNADYFPDPFAFRPERWLAEGVAEESDAQREHRATMRRAFVPFSLGSRSCAGQPMAYLELNLAVARAMWYFDFEKAPGEAGKLGEVPGKPLEFKLEDATIVGHHGPNLVLHPRGDLWKELLDKET
ncbi:hypothetical protein VPNG_10271 [Cytospora leucostoma]|uniref:Uncharacterized protein n=1 Tax=Cytospora leucostoma TaxID=1230097 RepID=A0A423VBY1_9PEZI|nr:hypothetical protein VPNG_10271 [Cytospora leucostoma]